LCNAKFAEKELPCRIDNRSYERQGIEQLPTIHEGPAVRQMEARGIRTNKGDLNRWIKATNDLLRRIKKRIAELLDLLAESKAEQSECVLRYLNQYYSGRNAGAYTGKARLNNTKQLASDMVYLEERGIVTVEQFEGYFSQIRQQVNEIRDAQNVRAARMKELKDLIRLADDYTRLKPIVDSIPPKGCWGKKHEKYMAEHDSEIRQFYAVKRKLDSYNLPDKKLTTKAWQAERDQLSEEYAADSEKLKPINADLKQLRDIQYKVNTAQHDQNKNINLRKDKEIAYE